MKDRKILSVIIAVCIVFSLGTASVCAYENEGYVDVSQSDWFYNSVNFASEIGIMTGVSKTEFAPNELMKRAMFVTALYRMDGEPAFMNDNVFSDVSSGAYYEKAVVWASGKGIVNGVTETEFAPNSEITREQIAKIIMNYVEYKNANTSVTADVSGFADFETDVSEYALDAIKYCIGEGIITGKSETEIAPKDNATRAEVAAILGRVYSLLQKDDDIVVLYTNDVHCAVSGKLGYDSLKAYKKRMEQTNGYVTLVDCGDAIQGDTVGTFSKGSYIIDIMNEVGYDYAILGNHEFDYGMEQLSELIDKSDAQYLNCNVRYTGTGKNALEKTKPYSIEEYGNLKVAYIGISTPYTITTSTPKFFKENDEFVYNFTNATEDEFYDCIQNNIDDCKNSGADIIVLLSHCGDDDETSASYKYSSVDLIKNTHGEDVVLDAHSHHVIESMPVTDENGNEVILSSTGTQFENIGQLVIKSDKTIEMSLVSDYKGKDIAAKNLTDDIKAEYEREVNKIVGTNDVDLSIYDSEGIRMIRNRELPIGDLCADALRIETGADIGIVNGGGVRDNLPKGDISINSIIRIHPYNNEICTIRVTGQQIADALEWSMKDVQAEYKKDGAVIGENGGFYQVSGIKFAVDTSVKNTVSTDENNMFTGVTGDRRVKDIMVLSSDGEYEPIDMKKQYTVASSTYILLNNGDGQTAFDGAEVVVGGGILDNEVLKNYIVDYLKCDLSQYAKGGERITIK